MRIFLTIAILLTGVSHARAAALTEQVAALYSEDPAARTRAVAALSGVKTAGEAAAIIQRFREELACAGKQVRPRACHDPKFVYGALLVAGSLARKDTGAPWDFLVSLSQGATVNEGSFFQDKGEADGHRGTDYFTPAVPDARLTREYLEETLDKAIEKAGLLPSCDWPLTRVKALAKKNSDVRGYQVYSYSRDYSPRDVAGQYRVVYYRDWLYRGDRLVGCGERTKVADLGPAGLYFAAISDRSDEQYRLDFFLYSLPDGKAACAYTVEGVSELTPEPLGEVASNPVKYLPALFNFSGGKCVPAKGTAYSYTQLKAE
ncbi:MAG: hypothetical protein PHV33_10965 [Elusimicrobiales bacterium]|nr:hypothetical protein [Elusimicrobiales bacterium]